MSYSGGILFIMITIFTDGSSRGNPGPGGWGSLVIEGDAGAEKVTELGGGERSTTNNRMEIMAAIQGVSHIPIGSTASVHTDSKYLINGITKWISGWMNNGWKTKAKEDVLNADLWVILHEAAGSRRISWKYVGGHIGILGNERCDHIATAFADGRSIDLYRGHLAAYDLPDVLSISFDQESLSRKKSSSNRISKNAHSYVSLVGGIIEVHHSWADCERRVKGARGARYKKSFSAEDEQSIIRKFEAI